MKQRIPLLLILILSACDSTGDTNTTPDVTGAIVANGGNFSDQNGSFSRLEIDSGQSVHGRVLDGFVQAAEPVEEEVPVMINTFSGGRIDIVAADGQSIRAAVPDIDAPRAAAILDGRAYVTTFAFDGSGQVLTVDVDSGSLVGPPIPTGQYPEGIAVTSTTLIVAEYGSLGSGTTVSVVDLDGGSGRTLELGCDGPRDVLLLSSGGAAISCLGKTVYNDDFSQILEQTPGQVVFLDSDFSQVEDRIPFDAQLGSTGAGQAAAVSWGEMIVLEGQASAIHRIDLNTRTLIGTWTLDDTGAYVGVSGAPAFGDAWLVGRMARAAGGALPDFTAAGQVVHLSSAGVTLASFEVGPAPTHIASIP